MKKNISEKFPQIKKTNRQKINKSSNFSFNIIVNQKYNTNSLSLSPDQRPTNLIFNINGRDFNYNNEKDFNSYLYINTERKKINLNNLRIKTEQNSIDILKNKENNKSQYYLPILMEKKINKIKLSHYLKESKPINIIGVLKQTNFNQPKKLSNNNTNNNKKSFSLHLETMSNNKKVEENEFLFKPKKNKFKNYYIKKGKTNKIIDNKNSDDYLEKIKEYRKKLKEQMINRYKMQYSQHGIKKSLKEKDDIKGKQGNQFVYNYDNKSINKINQTVNKALNIFYGKLTNSKISGYEKVFLKHSNESTEKYLANYQPKKVLTTIDIN